MEVQPPVVKKFKYDEELLSDEDAEIVKQLLLGIGHAVVCRLDAIEDKIDGVSINSKYLEDKLEQVIQSFEYGDQQINPQITDKRHDAFFNKHIVVVDQSCQGDQISNDDLISDGSKYQEGYDVIKLNSLETYPAGSWLGDKNNPCLRVRVGISPQDFSHINSHYQNPMKMALTLLDYLFDRDTLATSNLSGFSKHGKKKLDPLLIYGIKCHLIHVFDITEADWRQIKLNMDSKCRTAFSRKIRGIPQAVKAFRGRIPLKGYQSDSVTVIQADDSFQLEEPELTTEEDIDLVELISKSSAEGSIHVIEATPKQVTHIKNFRHFHQIQVLDDDNPIDDLEEVTENEQPNSDKLTRCIKKEISSDDV